MGLEPTTYGLKVRSSAIELEAPKRPQAYPGPNATLVHVTADGASGPGRPSPRRPLFFGPEDLEAHGGTIPGPAESAEIAHHSAAVLLGTGRAADDPAVTARLVSLVDDLGLDTLAHLWSTRPARSLPGALWRLYAVREGVRRAPDTSGREYAAGLAFADVAAVIAGVADPPTPSEVTAVVDQILTGVFSGDFGIALDRTSALCHVLAAGRAALAHDLDGTDPERATALTASAACLQSTAEDLRANANLWRADALS